MNTSSRTRKTKNLGFFLRIFSLIIIVSAIIISVVFSAKYVENNSKLSIEFAGGYQTQVQYEGKGKQKDVINLLKDRVDSLGASNVYIESITSSNHNKYNLALSKDAGVDISTFVHSVSRRGYSYIVDKDGNDLLATEKKDDKATTWTKRDKRLLTSDVFSNIKAVNNPLTYRPELVFDVKNDSVLKELTSAKENTFYIYSDICQLLDYIRSSMEGIRSLAFIIDNLKNDTDGKIKASLTSLLDNNTPGLGKGTDILARAKAQDPTLARLLNPNQNGQFGINWIYSDNLGSVHSLSVDTNDEKNTYDPANRFDPFASPIVGSPMNAWLPYIKDLLRLPDVSDILHEDVIDYRYIPYWVGEVKVTNNSISINSDTFNLETVEQMKSVLTSGLSKNNFTMLSYANVSPTLGATSLKIAVVIIILVTFVLMTIVLFYYRMLGVIVLIIISLFLLFTIVSFVFINGIIAPESVIALIIGFALLLDTIINLLERFKNEYMQGKTLVSTFKSANKKTLSSSLDCSAIILIVNLTIFWFGTRAIKGFIIMTSIATFGVIIFGIILLRLILWAVLRNNWLENKPQLLGTNNISRKSTIVLNNSVDTNNIKSSDKKIKDQLISEKCQLKISYKNKVKELIKKFKVDKQQLKKEHSKSRSVYKSKVKDLKLNLSQEINKLKQELINALKPLKIQIVKAKDKKIKDQLISEKCQLKISYKNKVKELIKKFKVDKQQLKKEHSKSRSVYKSKVKDLKLNLSQEINKLKQELINALKPLKIQIVKAKDKKIKDQLISEKCQLKISYKNKVKELIKKFKVDKQQLKKEHSKSRSVYKSKVKDLKLNLSQEINKLKQELINALKPLKIQIVKAKDKKIKDQLISEKCQLKISYKNKVKELIKKFKVDKQQLKKEHSKSRSVYKSKVKDLKLNLSQEINKLKQELINALKPLKIQIVKAKDKKILVNFKNVFSKLKISNWNYFHKLTKWVLSGSAVIVLASGITYGVIGSNFGSGFDQRTDFVGMGTITQDPSDPSYNIIKEAELAKDFISKKIQNNSQFSKYFKNINFSLIAGGEGKPYQFKIIVQTTVNSQSMQQRFKNFLGEITRNWKQESILQWGEIDLVVANSGVDLLVNMIISIALSFIVILIYIIIRFQLTYVIPLILAIIFSLLMTLAIISIFQIVISTSIVGILLGVMILTIISIMSIFDDIREIKINNNQTQVISTEEIIEISNKSVQKALPRILVINGVVLITSVIVMFIIPSFWIVSLSLLIGCIVSLVSSFFIAPFIWTYFEKWRVYRYKKRINKIKKHFIGADEYVIKGINE